MNVSTLLRASAFAAVMLFVASPASADHGGRLNMEKGDPASSAYIDARSAGRTCPEMMDSVDRLYAAYFNRAPDGAGYDYWADTYGSKAGTNLDVISQAFAESTEFQATYGPLSNQDFVTLVYRNVMNRTPDAAGYAHWLNALNNGYPRGSVMIAFSESEEYVVQTGTTAPLAGYLVWYDRSLVWDCFTGKQLVLPIPTAIKSPHVDIMLFNPGPAAIRSDLTFATINATGTAYHSALDAGSLGMLQPGMYNIYWNVSVPAGADAVVVDVPGADNATITVVVYDEPASTTRNGWTLYS